MAVEIDPGPAGGATLRAGTPKELFSFSPPTGTAGYDVSADGKRFLVIGQGAEQDKAATPELHFVVEWFDEIRRRTAAGKQ